MPAVFISLHNDTEKSRSIVIRNYRIDGQFQTGRIDEFIKNNHIGTEKVPHINITWPASSSAVCGRCATRRIP